MVYYAETNLIAIIVAVVLLLVERRSSFKHETPQIVMNYMLSLLIILSASDIAAYYFRGKSLIGVQVANVLYFEAMALGAYAWFIFILVKLGYAKNLKSTLLKTCLPVVLLCIALVFNPVTDFFFTVDDQLLYHRGTGVLLTWLVEWGYLFAALAATIKTAAVEKSSHRRREQCGYLLFAMPMGIAAVVQMLVYGVTTVQIGYMVGVLLTYLNRQFYQVHRDSLTGLSNRNAFFNYQDAEIARRSSEPITLFMVDMDSFKRINDGYGHLMGDNALRDAADVLKSASSVMSGRLLLFRYGGDEFVAVGRGVSEREISLFEQAVEAELLRKNGDNQARNVPYFLSMSIGYATGACMQTADFAALLRSADRAMYACKQEKGRVRS